MRPTTAITLTALAALLAACSDGTEPGTALAIKFGTPSASSASAASLSRVAAFGAARALQQGLVIAGSNGTLEITDIRVIVDEFELEPVEVASCDDVEPEPPECQEFEARFLFVQVPLSGEPVTVATDAVPPGRYDEFEFEVEDLELDDDDPEDAAEADLAQALLTRIRTQEGFADWPEKASMVVVGTFTPAGGGDPVPFRTYFEAEIEVEFDLVPPLEITADAAPAIVVQLNPEVWFSRADGTVLDLSQFDFATTGRLLEFELEIEEGFELEIES